MNKENKTGNKEVLDYILDNLKINVLDNKVLCVTLKDNFKENDLIKFGYIEKWTKKELKTYILNVLNVLNVSEVLRDYNELKNMIELKGICPYCFSLNLKPYNESEINAFYVVCLNCGEDIF